jgi:hypothetical protein
MISNNPKTSDSFKSAINTLSTNDIPLEEIHELIKSTFDNSKIYELQTSLNSLLKIAQEKRRGDTVRNILEALADLGGIATYDLLQLNIPEAVNFLIQTCSTKAVCGIMQKMLKKKMLPSDRAINATIDYALKEKLHEDAMQIVRLLILTNKWNAMYIKEIVRNLLLHGQVKSVCEILERLPLDAPGVNYVWENFTEYCSNKDHVKLLRELIDRIASKTLPKHTVEVTALYNCFLERMMGSKYTLPVVKMTMEDVARFRLKIKGSIVKDALLKTIEEKPDPRTFVHKILIFRYIIDAYIYGNMLTRLIQLDKKCETLTLVDLVMGDNGFGFTFNDLNLQPGDLKYIIKYQAISIKILKDDYRQASAERSPSPDRIPNIKPPTQSETMSIIDQLSLDDFEPLKNEDFEFLDSLPKEPLSDETAMEDLQQP